MFSPWRLCDQLGFSMLGELNHNLQSLAVSFLWLQRLRPPRMQHKGRRCRKASLPTYQIGANGNPFTSYVAITRVKDRQHLLIYRPFDAKPFQRGIGLGRDLLLRVWRQENVDWDAIRQAHIEEKPCSECFERKGTKAYTTGQWKRGDRDRICKECTWRHTQAGCPWQCSICKKWAPEDAFAGQAQRNPIRSFSRVCATCRQRKTCYRCRKCLPEENFNKSAWKTRHADRRICKACMHKDHLTCESCKICKEKSFFRRYTRKHPGRAHGHQVCDCCWFQADMLYYAANTNKRLARVRKTLKQKRVAQIVAEVYAHIAKTKQAVSTQVEPHGIAEIARQNIHTDVSPPTPNTPNKKATKPPLAPPSEAPRGKQSKTQERLFVYTCPFCKAAINSQVRTGRVDHRSACGHRFRVHNAQVVHMRHEHVCPCCGTKIVSAKASGRVQSQHRTPTGKACPQSEWVVRS